jgi:hypothetical protein
VEVAQHEERLVVLGAAQVVSLVDHQQAVRAAQGLLDRSNITRLWPPADPQRAALIATARRSGWPTTFSTVIRIEPGFSVDRLQRHRLADAAGVGAVDQADRASADGGVGDGADLQRDLRPDEVGRARRRVALQLVFEPAVQVDRDLANVAGVFAVEELADHRAGVAHALADLRDRQLGVEPVLPDRVGDEPDLVLRDRLAGVPSRSSVMLLGPAPHP